MLGSEKLANKALELYRERFSDVGMFENQIYAGIEDCLGLFFASKQAMYVVTSKPTIYSEKIIEYFGLAGYFRKVYGSNLDGSLANKTELIRFVLDGESVDAGDAVMIGDRNGDIAGAKSNGMRAIGVLWGYGSAQELTQAGADELCEDPSLLYGCVVT